MDPIASHCAMEIWFLPYSIRELTWSLKTSFRPSNYISIGVRGDIKFQMYGKTLWISVKPLGPGWTNIVTAQMPRTLILTRLLLNWNYSTNVFCNCNLANWLFIIFGCDCSIQCRENCLSVLICIWASALQTRVCCLSEHSHENVRGTNQFFLIIWKTYAQNHLWLLILYKQLFKPSLDPWQLESYSGHHSSWQTLPHWDSYNASNELSLMKNKNFHMNKNPYFSLLWNYSISTDSVQDSTHALVNFDLTG